MEASSGGKNKPDEQSTKPDELPKQDYIHVRARRGQATDSHSLAERVILFKPLKKRNLNFPFVNEYDNMLLIKKIYFSRQGEKRLARG